MKRNKGFTLLEIMIALVVLTIGLIAIAYMTNYAISGNREAKLLTQAVTLAQDKLEELRGVDYDALTSDNDAVNIDNIAYTRTWTVQTDASKEMKTAAVIVSWNLAAESVTFVTKVAK